MYNKAGMTWFYNCAKADKLKLNKVDELNTLAWLSPPSATCQNTNKAIVCSVPVN
jgi:hypothetical protein